MQTLCVYLLISLLGVSSFFGTTNGMFYIAKYPENRINHENNLFIFYKLKLHKHIHVSEQDVSEPDMSEPDMSEPDMSEPNNAPKKRKWVKEYRKIEKNGKFVYYCNYCNKEYKSTSGMVRHIQENCPNSPDAKTRKRYPCKYCERDFSAKRILDKHVETSCPDVPPEVLDAIASNKKKRHRALKAKKGLSYELDFEFATKKRKTK